MSLASVPYGCGARLRNWLFDRGWKKRFRAAVPVVSVGNLTLGGTGKTPCVEYIARLYRDRDQRVAVLSRGYGARAGRNDEALVLEENLPDVPHLQGADRTALARTAVEELDSEILVLDDGFQHRRLERDLDVVLIDASNPWGFGRLFPRGLLREPVSGLKRAGAVLLTRCDLVEPEVLQQIRQRVERMAPGKPIANTTHRPAGWINAQGQSRRLDAFTQVPVAGFCGIGNAEAFRQTLTKVGVRLIEWRVFPDHHEYTRADIESLRSWARALPTQAVLAATQKDLVKIRLERLGERELWALKIELQVYEGEEAFHEMLSNVIQPRRGG
ncbi:MAG: tetraacyldisaccharide 4'-kinase [Gemmataceae bacterium]|nr:tetraacyldisaccharide 4'-kinase [Gemmataceae bacterium]MCI0741672.1 tetraacyldisaccharide 4'-kinase [Gemmataceae bacterium]